MATRDEALTAAVSNNTDRAQDDNDDDSPVVVVPPPPDLSLNDIIDGDNGRGIPSVKFLSDVNEFVDSLAGVVPAQMSAELLIGAFSQLHAKYKSSEASLQGKQENLKQKIPELQKSISAIQSLAARQQQQQQQKSSSSSSTDNTNDDGGIVIRYALADNIFAKATLLPTSDTTTTTTTNNANHNNTLFLWLGANVMLEYTYDEALEFLQTNHGKAERDLMTISNDLAFCRDQIVTSEVNMSRIFNWDVRRKRKS